MKKVIRIDDLIYSELSYKIVGHAYDVFNELGTGHSEKSYQNAMVIAFEDDNLKFKQQVYYPLKFRKRLVGRRFLDFIVEEKVIVELKKNVRFSKAHIDQVLEYLAVSSLKLAILITFGKNQVFFKRVVHTKHQNQK